MGIDAVAANVSKPEMAEENRLDGGDGVGVSIEDDDWPRAPTDENTMCSASLARRCEVG